MRRETTTTRAALSSAHQSPVAALLIGAIYGLASGLALALAIVGGLLPESLAAGFNGGPLAFQAFLSSVGGLVGALATLVVTRRRIP